MLLADPIDWTWTNDATVVADTEDGMRYRYGYRYTWTGLWWLLLFVGGR